ncbi:MAG TPA: type II secretion system protein [Phycisphaerae bacterium]|nr:type II secretion system protein [Phycisphaerae bacterium]
MNVCGVHTCADQGNAARRRQGFTLVELLIVISIMALLASILLPSLSKAREMAKSSSCLSNLRNVGMSIAMYASEQKYYPTSYSYVDGDSSAGGYLHWTGVITPGDYEGPMIPVAGVSKYPKTANQYICPSHEPGGWAPSNFTTARIPNPPTGQVPQDATRDDKQAPRLSYVANEAIMPRKKFSQAHDIATPPGTSNLRLVSGDDIESPMNIILLAEFSNSPNCIWGSSSSGGTAYKSHRPTNGVKLDGGGVFDGEAYQKGTKIRKLTYEEAQAAITAVLADPGAALTSHHISYVNPATHLTYSNYAYADGHAAKATLKETLDAGNYMWGRKLYSCIDKPEIQDNDVP